MPRRTFHCIFTPKGIEVTDNLFSGNGFFGNPSNADMAEICNPADPGNCWHYTRRANCIQPSSDPPQIQSTHQAYRICGIPNCGLAARRVARLVERPGTETPNRATPHPSQTTLGTPSSPAYAKALNNAWKAYDPLMADLTELTAPTERRTDRDRWW